MFVLCATHDSTFLTLYSMTRWQTGGNRSLASVLLHWVIYIIDNCCVHGYCHDIMTDLRASTYYYSCRSVFLFATALCPRHFPKHVAARPSKQPEVALTIRFKRTLQT